MHSLVKCSPFIQNSESALFLVCLSNNGKPRERKLKIRRSTNYEYLIRELKQLLSIQCPDRPAAADSCLFLFSRNSGVVNELYDTHIYIFMYKGGGAFGEAGGGSDRGLSERPLSANASASRGGRRGTLTNCNNCCKNEVIPAKHVRSMICCTPIIVYCSNNHNSFTVLFQVHARQY